MSNQNAVTDFSNILSDLINTVENNSHLIFAVIVFALSYVAFYVLRKFIYEQLKKRATFSALQIVVERIPEISTGTASITSLYLAALTLTDQLPEAILVLLQVGVVVAWARHAIALAGSAIDVTTKSYIRSEEQREANEAIVRLLGNTAKVGVWIVAFLILLSTLGINVSSLVAGLGIGGIAVALAVQAVLGDFISSVTLAADKPFKVGDFIIVGDFIGTVEKIGVKSTRVESIDGEQIIMPNSELVSKTIRNYGTGEHRRSLHQIGVTYETDPQLVKEVPEMIKAIFRQNEMVEDDTFRVNLIEFADSSILFEMHFYVKTFDYDEFLDIQEEVLISIMEKFIEEEIDFAYPTRMIHNYQPQETVESEDKYSTKVDLRKGNQEDNN